MKRRGAVSAWVRPTAQQVEGTCRGGACVSLHGGAIISEGLLSGAAMCFQLPGLGYL